MVVRQRLLEILPASVKMVAYLEINRQPQLSTRDLVDLLCGYILMLLLQDARTH